MKISTNEEYIIDLLIDFDEMGFTPTTLVPNPEVYAIDWRRKITNAFKQFKAEIITNIFRRINFKLTYYKRYRDVNNIVFNFFEIIGDVEKEFLGDLTNGKNS